MGQTLAAFGLVNCVINQQRRWLECVIQQQSGHIEH